MELEIEKQRRAAQQCIQLREQCGLSYEPIIIYQFMGTITMTPADSLRAECLTAENIIEFVDMEKPHDLPVSH
jgi:hypothetical protein